MCTNSHSLALLLPALLLGPFLGLLLDLLLLPAAVQDGYAVVSSDGPGEYAVIGESRAGYMDDMHLAPGQVAYITTGGWQLHWSRVPACTNL